MISIMLEALSGQVVGLDMSSIDAKIAEEIAKKCSAVLKIKGVKANKAAIDAIPTTQNEIGDVWIAQDTSIEWAWVKNAAGTPYWEAIGSSVDLTGYYTKTQVDDLVNGATAPKTLQISELFRRVGECGYYTPSEEDFKEDIMYFRLDTNGVFTQNGWSDPVFGYNPGDSIAQWEANHSGYKIRRTRWWSDLTTEIKNLKDRVMALEDKIDHSFTFEETEEGRKVVKLKMSTSASGGGTQKNYGITIVLADDGEGGTIPEVKITEESN